MRHLTWLLTAGLAVTTTALAQQTQLPTDADLRSVYCIKMLEFRVELAREAVVDPSQRDPNVTYPPFVREVDEQRAKDESTLARLKAYLLPRLLYLDPV